MVCRPVDAGIFNVLGPKHCFVTVWHWSDKCPKQKIIDEQFSVGENGRTPQLGDKVKDDVRPWLPSTYAYDNSLFYHPEGSTEFYDIPVPSNMSSSDFDHAVTVEGYMYYSPDPYHGSGILGPNSNTAATEIIRNAGGSVPNIPGAFGQSYYSGNNGDGNNQCDCP